MVIYIEEEPKENGSLVIASVKESSRYDVDSIRRSEYPLLEGADIYLDHTGTTLFPRSALDRFVRDVTSNLYGNPHSESKSSRQSTLRIEEIRKQALQFFNASPEDFDLIFVQNATAAIKLVVEVLQSHAADSGGFWYGYHADSHTSLVGIREVAAAGFAYFSNDREVEDWIAQGTLNHGHQGTNQITRLFAYPGQSNMTGRRLPLTWPGLLRKSVLAGHKNVYTLLDAAALASTSELDLSNAEEAPDFIALSFYKIFGFPDLGALLVRREVSPILQSRKYFGGGTVEMVVNGIFWRSMHAGQPHEYLEDGTLPFHNIIALGHALTTHKQLYTSQKLVSRHTARLARYLYDNLSGLCHWDGSPLCVIYKDPRAEYGDASTTGPIIAFNIRYIDGAWVKLSDVEKIANKHHIHLRTGGLCNPGGIASSLDLAPWELFRNYAAGVDCGRGPAIIGGKPSGVVRVSLGAMSNTHDVDVFIDFMRSQFLNVRSDGVSRWERGIRIPISQIMIYPLDGARAWRTPAESSWPIQSSGLRWDREWFLVDLATLKVLTREMAPQLMLLYPEVDSAARLLRIDLHRSLRNSPGIGLDHICLPLEHGKRASQTDRARCGVCGTRRLRFSPQTVMYQQASVSGQVCFSEDVVKFFSFAIGRDCTAARISNPASGGQDRIVFAPEELHRTIIVENYEPPLVACGTAGDLPSTTTSVAFSSTGAGADRMESHFPPYEGLAESMQANIVLAESPDVESAKLLSGWLFMSIGRRFFVSDANGTTSSYNIASVTGDTAVRERLYPGLSGAGLRHYKLAQRSGNLSEMTEMLQMNLFRRFTLT
ncbi:hypothetical protein jhhlp_008760 [Lomentospora prolificans]|uniref:Molybdenum cofactor sulfurase n=1 Tax=Lomentospora prolificans TaxID=41688 RepID=A0A2N3MYZ7_9PEZI|nr:hypothetical protein jhhlp_008760 [Lomentospora prolificans]